MTDTIADMLTKIRNASGARRESVLIPASNMKIALARTLKESSYVRNFEVRREGPKVTLKVWLNYLDRKVPAITGIQRVSKPGLRVYAASKALPRGKGGVGIAIVTTPKGVMTTRDARRIHVGGEVLAYVW